MPVSLTLPCLLALAGAVTTAVAGVVLGRRDPWGLVLVAFAVLAVFFAQQARAAADPTFSLVPPGAVTGWQAVPARFWITVLPLSQMIAYLALPGLWLWLGLNARSALDRAEFHGGDGDARGRH